MVDTLVVGDSLTWYATPHLELLRPRWHIDAVRGREIDRLIPRIDAYVADYGVPGRLVIALGTNEGEGFDRSVYDRALERVNPGTKVVFVTTYRDPKVFGEERAEQQRLASEWMDDIARARAYTAIAGWRRRVMAFPHLLHDGVHATAHGEQVWANLVHEAMNRALEP